MESKFFELEFGKIHYTITFSDKETTLIFLHSFHSSASSFSKVCNSLKTQFNIICLDFQGHGKSDPIKDEKFFHYYSVNGTSTTLKELIKSLKITNFVIIGNSIGGNASVRAIPSLNGLKGLILVASIQTHTVTEVFDTMYDKALTDLLFKQNIDEYEIKKLAQAYVYETSEYPEGLHQMELDIKNTDPHFREYLRISFENQKWVDEVEIIKNTNLPLLYLLGEEDRFINCKKYRKHLIDKGITNSQITTMPAAGHCPHLSQPQKFAAHIFQFMSNV